MIFINFKTYEGGTGERAVELAKNLSEVSTETHVKIVPVVQPSDVRELVDSMKLEVWVQKIDPVDPGAHTGSILPEAVVEDGAAGTFLNHSENKIESYNKLSESVNQAHDAGLKTLIFAGSIDELKKVAGLKPTYISFEPPELVGSKDTSVAEAKPELIEKAAEIARSARLPLIVGAGIKSAEDVRVSMKLGAAGVAVASGVVKSEDPKKSLLELAKGFEG